MRLNTILSFILELSALFVYAWVPFAFLSSNILIVKVMISVVLVISTTLAWSRFAAPKSDTRLHGWSLLAFKALILMPAAVLFGIQHGTGVFIVSLVLVLSNVLIELRTSS